MFELLNEDLEDCLEILKQMSEATPTERYRILAENRVSKKDIKKTVDLCELICYYNDKVNKGY